MANEEQLKILKQGVDVWNKWRHEHLNTYIDLKEVDLSKTELTLVDFREANLKDANLREATLNGARLKGAILSGADFSEAKLIEAFFSEAKLMGAFLGGADLTGADLKGANLTGAHLRQTNLSQANLSDTILKDGNLFQANLGQANLRRAALKEADLRGADLSEANLCEANLNSADLRSANMSGANLSKASLIKANLYKANLSNANLNGAMMRGVDLTEANLTGANLSESNLNSAILVNAKIDKAIISNSSVYAVSVWDLEGEFEQQRSLIITKEGQPLITVDNIKVAQFLYLILNNEEIRDVINTITSKSVLILGRFAIPERKGTLDALRNKLREYDLLPIVFDFDRPTDKDFTETIKTLAGLCYFVIADVTNPKSSPLELQATVPDYQIPFVPIIQEGESPFAMMVDLQKKYNWVLPTVTYDSVETLIKVLKPLIIDPAMKKRQELRIIKAQEPEVISGKDYLEKDKE